MESGGAVRGALDFGLEHDEQDPRGASSSQRARARAQPRTGHPSGGGSARRPARDGDQFAGRKGSGDRRASAARRIARACRELGAAAAELELGPGRERGRTVTAHSARGARRAPQAWAGPSSSFLSSTEGRSERDEADSVADEDWLEDYEGSGSERSIASGDRAGLEGLALRSVAPATLKVYGQAWSEWEAFVQSRQHQGKSKHRLMLSFMWQLYVSGRSRAVVARYLAGVSFFCKLRGISDVTKSEVLRKAMKGWARVAPTPPDRRRPIDAALLPAVIEAVGRVASSRFEALLFRLAFSMAYHGAFRVSELVAPSKRSESRMLVGDVVVGERSLLCRLRRSKTDQVGRGRWVTMVPALEVSVCPVGLARQYLGVRPAKEGSWLLHYDGLPVTKYQFRWMLGRCLTGLGLSPAAFGTHSFRIGAATSAAAAGFSRTEIQAVGRWKSSSYKRYIRPVT
ncbi:uncharacterized protein LOC134928678 [Pseudophryne corroboree]|uniref:uncharacterized protein LOC134928678 n=1 Tax=Pseudophryne corroboree TaxID=495146 RepID=UPI0030816129